MTDARLKEIIEGCSPEFRGLLKDMFQDIDGIKKALRELSGKNEIDTRQS